MTEGGMDVVCFNYKKHIFKCKKYEKDKKGVRRRRTVSEKLPNLEM